jgi:hypothetical protein
MNSNTAKIEDGYLCIGDHRIPLLAGEMHYWQHLRLRWKDILQAVKDCALPIVTTRPGWEFHEVEPGKFDFTGETDPQRDLRYFMDVATDVGLWVFFRFAIFSRPGPAIHAHWWAGGTPTNASSLPKLHPEFLERANEYISAAGEILAPYSVNKGGCLLLCQIENEIRFDHNERWADQCYYGSPESSFTYYHWLLQRYGSLDSINRAYGKRHVKLTDIRVPKRQDLRTPGDYLIFADVMRYELWYCEEYIRQLTGMIRNAGIDVPTVQNLNPRFELHDISALQEIADLVGVDYWYANLMPWEQVIEFFANAKHLRGSARIAWSPEFQSASAEPLMDLYKVTLPQNATYLSTLGMMSGLKGWSWFMFVERGGQYFAPIDISGQPIEPYFSKFKRVHTVFQDIEFPTWEKMSSTGILWYRPQFWLEPTIPWSPGTDWEAARVSLSRSYAHYTHEELSTEWYKAFDKLHRADIDCEVLDFDSRHNKMDSNGMLFYVGHQVMELKAQHALLEFANGGGHLVFVSGPPISDLDAGKTSVFDFLSPPLHIQPWRGDLKIVSPLGSFVTDTSYLARFSAPEGADVFENEFGCCGYSTVRGKGRITVLGFDLTPNAYLHLHHMFDIPVYATCTTPGILTSVWTRGSGVLLFVVNTNEEDSDAVVRLQISVLGLTREPVKVKELLSSKDVVIDDLSQFTLQLKGKDAMILRLR